MSNQSDVHKTLDRAFKNGGAMVCDMLTGFLCIHRHGRAIVFSEQDRDEIVKELVASCRAASDEAILAKVDEWAFSGVALASKVDKTTAWRELWVVSVRAACEWFLAETAPT